MTLVAIVTCGPQLQVLLLVGRQGTKLSGGAQRLDLLPLGGSLLMPSTSGGKRTTTSSNSDVKHTGRSNH